MQKSHIRRKWNTKGSITVEMCVLIPIALSVLLILAGLLRIGVTTIYLDSVMSKVCGEVARNSYAIEAATGKVDDKVINALASFTTTKPMELLLSQIGDSRFLKSSNLDIEIFDMPFEEGVKDRTKYIKYGMEYKKENVVLVVKYKYNLTVPLLSKTIYTTHIAVERGWINGEYKTKDKVVFITNTGKKYHIEDCRYLGKSSIEIEIEEAKEQGYEPCSVCKP